MTDTVAHYLHIYRLRKAMMDDGSIKPNAEGRALICRLVTRLSELDPSLPCELLKSVDSADKLRYTFVVEGEEIAHVIFDSDVPQSTEGRD